MIIIISKNDHHFLMHESLEKESTHLSTNPFIVGGACRVGGDFSQGKKSNSTNSNFLVL